MHLLAAATVHDRAALHPLSSTPKMVEFNKMFVMLPVMLAARKLDGEDPNVIFMLRCIYGAVQTIAVLTVLFIYAKASAAAKDSGNKVKIYVPPPPQVKKSFVG